MGLPIVALARLADRAGLHRRPSPPLWRLVATAALLVLVLPILLTAAVATVPVLLSTVLIVGLRRLWQWQAQRTRGSGREWH